MKADCSGTIQMDGSLSNISGLAYSEKTYGSNFPTKWIWLQSNHNSNEKSFSFSLGKVPIGPFRINGFFLLINDGTETYRFSTTNFSKIRKWKTDDKFVIQISKGSFKVTLKTTNTHTVKLVGPRKHGLMNLEVLESISASTTINLYDKNELVFEESFSNVGCEYMF